MILERETNERRGYKRFPVKDRSIAVLGNDGTGLGEVLDMSMAGFSFHYLDRGVKLAPRQKLTLISDDDLWCAHIPMKIVTDRPCDDSREIGLRRRCGVQFGELTSNQASKVEYLILKFTVNMED